MLSLLLSLTIAGVLTSLFPLDFGFPIEWTLLDFTAFFFFDSLTCDEVDGFGDGDASLVGKVRGDIGSLSDTCGTGSSIGSGEGKRCWIGEL